MSTLFGRFGADPSAAPTGPAPTEGIRGEVAQASGTAMTIGDAVAGPYDAASKTLPQGVAMPENPVSENLGFFSKWWPALKGVLEMGMKGSQNADSAVVGEGATTTVKNLAGMAADGVIGPGAGDMVEAGLSQAEMAVDPFIPHPQGIKGVVGDEVKNAGAVVEMLAEAGGEMLDDVGAGVETGVGAAVGVVDAAHKGTTDAIRIMAGEPDTSGLPTELPPIEQQADFAWEPTVPALPPTHSVTLPVDEDPFSVS